MWLKRFHFSRAAEAHRLLETGHVRGKLVLVRDQDAPNRMAQQTYRRAG